MGTEAKKIVKLDIDKVVDLLNKALADEWLAYYQYWIGAKITVGPLRGTVIAELIEHAEDELRHADMLVERILQLGGVPLLDPKEWYKKTNCGYKTPKDAKVKSILDQNIKGEQCAIKVYSKLADLTEGRDRVTYNIVLEILKDEIEHEEDLQVIKEDLKQF